MIREKANNVNITLICWFLFIIVTIGIDFIILNKKFYFIQMNTEERGFDDSTIESIKLFKFPTSQKELFAISIGWSQVKLTCLIHHNTHDRHL